MSGTKIAGLSSVTRRWLQTLLTSLLIVTGFTYAGDRNCEIALETISRMRALEYDEGLISRLWKHHPSVLENLGLLDNAQLRPITLFRGIPYAKYDSRFRTDCYVCAGWHTNSGLFWGSATLHLEIPAAYMHHGVTEKNTYGYLYYDSMKVPDDRHFLVGIGRRSSGPKLNWTHPDEALKYPSAINRIEDLPITDSSTHNHFGREVEGDKSLFQVPVFSRKRK